MSVSHTYTVLHCGLA